MDRQTWETNGQANMGDEWTGKYGRRMDRQIWETNGQTSIEDQFTWLIYENTSLN